MGPRAARCSIASSTLWPPTVSFETIRTWAGSWPEPVGWAASTSSTSFPPGLVAARVSGAIPVRRAARMTVAVPVCAHRHLLAVAVQDRVHRAGNPVLVGAADNLRDLVEVEDRRGR